MDDHVFDIDADLVSGLLEDQHADLAALPLGERYEGMDTVVFRLGEKLAVRLPRSPLSIDRVGHRVAMATRALPLMEFLGAAAAEER